MTVEVTSDEIVDLHLGLLMKILELVRRRELLHVQAVRQYAVRFPLQKMLALVCSDVGHSGKNIGRMRSGAFDTVSVVDAALSSLGIHIEVLQVIVEIDGPCAQVAAEERGVGGEYGGNINSSLLAERQANTSKPLVELSNDCSLLLMVDVLLPS